MYVTFRRYKVNISKAKEVIDRVNKGFVPILTRSMGFVSYSIFLDEKGYICSVSTFKTRAGMQEANEMAIDWVDENIRVLLPNAPEVYEGESLLDQSRPDARF